MANELANALFGANRCRRYDDLVCFANSLVTFEWSEDVIEIIYQFDVCFWQTMYVHFYGAELGVQLLSSCWTLKAMKTPEQMPFW